MQDDILAADKFGELAGQIEPNRRRNLEPGFSGGHARRQIGRAHARGECAQSAVGAGVGIRADNGFSRTDQPFLREEGMLDSHFSYVIEILQVEASGEGPAFFTLLRALDVFVRGEVIHDERNSAPVEDAVKPRLIELIDGYRTGDVICQHHVQPGVDQLPRRHMIQTGVSGEDLLCHCHSHIE